MATNQLLLQVLISCIILIYHIKEQRQTSRITVIGFEVQNAEVA